MLEKVLHYKVLMSELSKTKTRRKLFGNFSTMVLDVLGLAKVYYQYFSGIK